MHLGAPTQDWDCAVAPCFLQELLSCSHGGCTTLQSHQQHCGLHVLRLLTLFAASAIQVGVRGTSLPWLTFPMAQGLSIFPRSCQPLRVFPIKMSTQILCPFLGWIIYFYYRVVRIECAF